MPINETKSPWLWINMIQNGDPHVQYGMNWTIVILSENKKNCNWASLIDQLSILYKSIYYFHISDEDGRYNLTVLKVYNMASIVGFPTTGHFPSKPLNDT